MNCTSESTAKAHQRWGFGRSAKLCTFRFDPFFPITNTSQGSPACLLDASRSCRAIRAAGRLRRADLRGLTDLQVGGQQRRRVAERRLLGHCRQHERHQQEGRGDHRVGRSGRPPPARRLSPPRTSCPARPSPSPPAATRDRHQRDEHDAQRVSSPPTSTEPGPTWCRGPGRRRSTGRGGLSLSAARRRTAPAPGSTAPSCPRSRRAGR